LPTLPWLQGVAEFDEQQAPQALKTAARSPAAS